MLMKNAVAALMGLAMVAEAASVHQYGTPTRTVGRRQFGKKNNFGNRFGNGQFGGGQNGQNNNNNNNGQNNNGQNNNGQNNNGQNNNNNNNNNNNGGNNNQASETCLAAAALQTGSQSTGQNGAQAADGQVNSATDNANFINFCQGKTLTNGLQNRDGSCNGIPMGEIPSANRMVSTVILNPKNGDDLEPLTTFQIQVNVANMQLGAFTNATSTYYSAPQTLNGGGQIIGHTHVTVQDTGNTLNPTQPLDATVFAFFKGINDAGNGNGQLAAEVTGGLPTGCYRVCTMSSASNHQPVLMPVAQRGSQEDCRYFSVGGACANNNNNNNGGGNNNNNNNNNNNGGNNNNNNNNGGDQGQNNQGQNQGNQGQGNQGQQNNQGNQGNNQGQNNQGNQNNNQGNQGAGNQAGGGSGAGNNGNGNNGGNNNNNGGGNAGAAIAGIQPPPVTDSGNADRPFAVNGNTFVTRQEAQFRACAIQNNACAGAVNSGQAPGRTVPDCNAQEAACRAAA